MRSPIPESFWDAMFKVGITTVSAAMLWSLWRQHKTSRSRFSEQWAIVSARPGTHNLHKVAEALKTIHAGVLEERNSRKGTCILGVIDHVKPLLAWLQLDEENKNDDITVIAHTCLQIVTNAFAKDRATRTILANAGGYEKLVRLMSQAVGANDTKILDLAAQALAEATDVDEKELVLPADVPEGCEGSYSLARQKNFPKLLKILKPEARLRFLQSASGALANISLLRVGAQAISKGYQGLQGQKVFRTLIDHADSTVATNATKALSFLIMHNKEDAHEAVQSAEMDQLTAILDVGKPGSILEAVLRCFELLYESEYQESFLTEIARNGAFKNLCEIWISTQERSIRKRAERLVLRGMTHTNSAAQASAQFNAFNHKIKERAKKDQEEDAKAEEQARKQQYMQQMMMQQMMGAGGMPPGMAAMMEDD